MTNIEKLAERINRSPNPQLAFAAMILILSVIKGNRDKATPESITAILETAKKEGTI